VSGRGRTRSGTEQPKKEVAKGKDAKKAKQKTEQISFMHRQKPEGTFPTGKQRKMPGQGKRQREEEKGKWTRRRKSRNKKKQVNEDGS